MKNYYADNFKEAFKIFFDKFVVNKENYEDVKSIFSDALRALLYLNVDILSSLDVSSKCETTLNWLGFTGTKTANADNNYVFLTKYEIKQLQNYLFEAYQNYYQNFASTVEVEAKFPNEVEKISEACNNPLIKYLAVMQCQNPALATQENINVLKSGNEREIEKILVGSKETKKLLIPLSKDMAELVSAFVKEKENVSNVQTSFSTINTILNPDNLPTPCEVESIKEELEDDEKDEETGGNDTEITANELLETLKFFRSPLGKQVQKNKINLDSVVANYEMALELSKHLESLHRLQEALTVSLDFLLDDDFEVELLTRALQISIAQRESEKSEKSVNH